MTRKEAIDYLEISMTIDDSRYHNEVLKFIIKELDQEPFINKPCISAGVCEHDKQKVLNKIRAEIELEKLGYPPSAGYCKAIMKCLKIIDKYKAESEE